jgi:DNA-binding beta-propeller fold protein YncE
VKPGELTRIEDTLRRAYGDVLAAIERDGTWPEVPLALPPGRPPRGADRPGGRRRWLAPAAAAATVAVVALVAGLVVPRVLQQPRPRPASARAKMAYLVGGERGSDVDGLMRGLNFLLPVDLATGRALRPIALGVPGEAAGVMVAPNGRTVYVATEGGDVVPVDVATHKARRPIRIAADPFDELMSPNGHTGYFLDPEGVATVNFVTNRPGRVFKMQDPGGFALTPNGKTLYVASGHGQEVIPVDTTTLRTGSPISTGDYNYFYSARLVMAPNGRTVYLLSGRPGTPGQVLTPIDVATGTVLPPIIVSASALGAAPTISPDSRSAYLDTGYGIMAVDLRTGSIRWTLDLGGPNGAYQAVVSPDSRTVYITGNDYDIVPTNAASGRQLTPVLRDWAPLEMAFSPDGTLYLLGMRVTKKTHVGTFSWGLTGFNPATGGTSRPISLPAGMTGSWGYLEFGP